MQDVCMRIGLNCWQMTVTLIFMAFAVCAHLENTDESINQLRYADRYFLRPLIIYMRECVHVALTIMKISRILLVY